MATCEFSIAGIWTKIFSKPRHMAHLAFSRLFLPTNLKYPHVMALKKKLPYYILFPTALLVAWVVIAFISQHRALEASVEALEQHQIEAVVEVPVGQFLLNPFCNDPDVRIQFSGWNDNPKSSNGN